MAVKRVGHFYYHNMFCFVIERMIIYSGWPTQSLSDWNTLEDTCIRNPKSAESSGYLLTGVYQIMPSVFAIKCQNCRYNLSWIRYTV